MLYGDEYASKQYIGTCQKIFIPDHQMSTRFWGSDKFLLSQQWKHANCIFGEWSKISLTFRGKQTCPKQVDQHEASHSPSPCEPAAYCKTQACSYKTCGNQCGGSLGRCHPPLCPAAAGIVLGENQKGMYWSVVWVLQLRTIFPRALLPRTALLTRSHLFCHTRVWFICAAMAMEDSRSCQYYILEDWAHL